MGLSLSSPHIAIDISASEFCRLRRDVTAFPRNLLEAFMLFDQDWEQHLAAPSYCITTKYDGDFAIMKYQQLNSDFSLPLVQLCRGIIVHVPTKKTVCLPFTKFFNYGEGNAAEIDWFTASVTEKIDGSLMKMWCYNGTWHLSTNGTIDAFKAGVGDTDFTFGSLFEKVLGLTVQEYGDKFLSPGYCYMFELAAPENQVVIEYKDAKIYLLAARDMDSLQEIPVRPAWLTNDNVILPRRYNLQSLTDTIDVVKDFSKDEEGVVVCDGQYNRIKIKSPAYLEAAHLANNGKITTKRILNMIHNETIDDFLGVFPQHQGKVNEIISRLQSFEVLLDEAWKTVEAKAQKENFISRFQWYKTSQQIHPIFSDYVMSRYDNKVENAAEYMQKMRISGMKKAIAYVNTMSSESI